MKKALIVQGGGFRTAFSAGVLDAFIKNKHNPFSLYVGVSGGAIAASYFIANQPRHCLDAIKFLSASKRYLDFTRLLTSKAIVDVQVFHDISTKFMPFDYISAEKNLLNKRLAIVMTNRETGNPNYYHPTINNWQDSIIASCSFPFITEGKQHIEGIEYMDGAWSDPLPIEWVVNQGATDITIVRTMLAHEKISKSWLDLVGEIYYRNDEGLKSAFTKNHLQYNQSIDFINNPPKGITIRQIAPDVNLKAGVYTNSKSLIDEDYVYGFEKGNAFLELHQNREDIRPFNRPSDLNRTNSERRVIADNTKY